MRLQVLKRISYLEDKHCSTCTLLDDGKNDDKYLYCRTKCDVGKELQECGNELIEISNRKSRKILKKGKDMTTNDIQYLINRGYTKDEIGQALGLSKTTAQRMLKDFSGYGEILYKHSDNAVIMNRVFYLLDKGLTVKEIVNKTNFNEGTVYNYRTRWNKYKRSKTNGRQY